MELLLSLPTDSIQAESTTHYLRRNLDILTSTNIPTPIIDIFMVLGISLIGVSCCYFTCCSCIIEDVAEEFVNNIV